MLQLTPSAHALTAAKTAHALRLQTTPPVYVIVISGTWLLTHTTPSWRIKDPLKGFQRIVNETRAKQIARTVLDRGRAFPNAITLATNVKDFRWSGNDIILPDKAKFLVVDGQHRLWAQKFSDTDGQYACIIHLNKTEREMAELFLEINENQRRVPSSLRWDLVRLVRPEKDEATVTAADLVYLLATREDSPFYLSVDLTGEDRGDSIKQGSLAPEIKTLAAKAKKKHNPTIEQYESLLIQFFSAVKSLNPNGWGDPASTYYRARVLRALIRVLVDLVLEARSLDTLTAPFFLTKLQKIDPETLSEDRLRAAQGSAGVADLYRTIKNQVFS
jgi:DGQHR domain-containing protein